MENISMKSLKMICVKPIKKLSIKLAVYKLQNLHDLQIWFRQLFDQFQSSVIRSQVVIWPSWQWFNQDRYV